MPNSNNSAFTLLEIVIAISLIGLFVTVPVIAYGNLMKKSRDIKRKNDINQMQVALQRYKLSTGTYVDSSSGYASLQKLVNLGYIGALPVAPANGQPYSYTANGSLSDYELSAQLESSSSIYKATSVGIQTIASTSQNSTVTQQPTPTTYVIPTLSPTTIPTLTSVIPSVVSPTTQSPTSTPSHSYYVSTSGLDTNPGTLNAPFRTVNKAITALVAGDILYIRGGTYNERIQNPAQNSGTSTSPITVKAYLNEIPVIQGLLWLNKSTFWIFDGLHITWDSTTGQANEHMVKFSGGHDWLFTNGDIGNAKSYAGLLISGNTYNWTVSYSYIHDTANCLTECSGSTAPHTVNQDHLVYVDNTTNGIFDHNLFVNSPNGRGIKLGPPSGVGGPGFVTIQYNTFDNNLGPANIQMSGESHDNVMYKNILSHPKNTSTYNITQNNISGIGGNNNAYNNIGYLSAGVVQSDPTLLKDGGGNMVANPQFDSTYHPQNALVQSYGRFAP